MVNLTGSKPIIQLNVEKNLKSGYFIAKNVRSCSKIRIFSRHQGRTASFLGKLLIPSLSFGESKHIRFDSRWPIKNPDQGLKPGFRRLLLLSVNHFWVFRFKLTEVAQFVRAVFSFFKWSLCLLLGCQFNRRQHHGVRFVRCFFL